MTQSKRYKARRLRGTETGRRVTASSNRARRAAVVQRWLEREASADMTTLEAVQAGFARLARKRWGRYWEVNADALAMAEAVVWHFRITPGLGCQPEVGDLMRDVIYIVTDGACSYPSRVGGWGVVVAQAGFSELTLWGSAKDTTSQRMELKAGIEGLRAGALGGLVRWESDSKYALGVGCWGWKAQANLDLVEELRAVVAEIERMGVQLEVRHVPGHAGLELQERADKLAVYGRKIYG